MPHCCPWEKQKTAGGTLEQMSTKRSGKESSGLSSRRARDAAFQRPREPFKRERGIRREKEGRHAATKSCSAPTLRKIIDPIAARAKKFNGSLHAAKEGVPGKNGSMGIVVEPSVVLSRKGSRAIGAKKTKSTEGNLGGVWRLTRSSRPWSAWIGRRKESSLKGQKSAHKISGRSLMSAAWSLINHQEFIRGARPRMIQPVGKECVISQQVRLPKER